MLVCSNVAARRGRRRRARGRAARRARRPRRRARDPDRLRGARLGPPRQRLRARVADRRGRRSPGARDLPRLLPHPLARDRPGGHPRDPRRPHPLPPARRRAAPRDGRPAVEPPLPLLPRPGRASTSPTSPRHVLAAGYAGPLSLEVFNDVFRQADPERMAVDALRSLLLLEDELGLLELPAPARARRLRVRGARRAPADAARTPRTLLAAMGFHHVGPHRTKPVQLWAQDDVRGSCSTTATAARRGSPRSPCAATTRGLGRARRGAARARARPPARRGRGRPGAVAAPDGTSMFFCGDDAARPATSSRWRGDARRDGAAAACSASTTSGCRSRSTLRRGGPVLPRRCSGLRAGRGRRRRRARRPAAQPRGLRPDGQRAPRAHGPAARRRRSRTDSPSCSTSRSPATTCSPPRARCASAACRCSRCPPTTTTTSTRASIWTPAFLARAARARRPLRPRRGRRAAARVHGHGRRPPVLRGGRAPRRLRRATARPTPPCGWPHSARSAVADGESDEGRRV